jgi:effector-binding domain-containing protein
MEKLMPFECKTQTMPAQPVLSVRTQTTIQNLPQVLGETYRQIFEYMQELGAWPAGAPFVAYYNMDAQNPDVQNLDMEIGFPVAASLPARGAIQFSELPQRQAATCIYTGPYDGMGAAYDAINAHMAQNGLTLNGPIYEVYLNDPSETSARELQTEIIFPVD